MQISEEKTKLMTNNTNGISTDIRISDVKLDCVDSFKYLGAIVADEGSKPEVLALPDQPRPQQPLQNLRPSALTTMILSAEVAHKPNNQHMVLVTSPYLAYICCSWPTESIDHYLLLYLILSSAERKWTGAGDGSYVEYMTYIDEIRWSEHPPCVSADCVLHVLVVKSCQRIHIKS